MESIPAPPDHKDYLLLATVIVITVIQMSLKPSVDDAVTIMTIFHLSVRGRRRVA
jgi:hypothetical protein